MTTFPLPSSPSPKPLLNLALIAALATAAGVSAPRQAAAGDAGRIIGGAVAIGIIGTAAYCATHPNACGQNGGGGGGAVADAIALTREQAIWVQQGLQAMGYYQGAIDGALGAGSRNAIRAYQASIGAPQTGALTGRQINDLVVLAPTFAGVGPGDPFLFNADLANDVTPDEMRQIQAALNRQGFNAGSVDGAFGGMTRNAIAAYKASYGLPGGPVATRRLLAQLTGAPAAQGYATMAPAAPVVVSPAAPGLGGKVSAMPTAPSAAQPTAQPTAQPRAIAPTAPVETAAPPGALSGAGTQDLGFDLLGLTLGMSEEQASQAIRAEIGPDIVFEIAGGESIAGNDVLTSGAITQQAAWPAPSSERFFTVSDRNRPELGVIAAFRLIHMPDSVDQAVFESQILPDIVAKYGAEGRVGDGLTWVGSAAARAATATDPAQLAGCGDLRLAIVADRLWSSGGGVQFDPASLGSVTANCGQVLKVSYEGGIIRIGMWDSAAISGEPATPDAGAAAAAPEIKF